MNRIISCCDSGIITVEAGVSFHDINAAIHEAGFAMESLPCTPEISVLGSILTSSHGAGLTTPSLPALVHSMTLMDPQGKLRTLTRDDADLALAVTSMGLMGVVVSFSLVLVPAYDVAQAVYEDVGLEHVISPYFSPYQRHVATGDALDAFAPPRVSLLHPTLPPATTAYQPLTVPSSVSSEPLRVPGALSRAPLSPLQAQSNLEHLLTLGYSVSLFTIFQARGSRMASTREHDRATMELFADAAGTRPAFHPLAGRWEHRVFKDLLLRHRRPSDLELPTHDDADAPRARANTDVELMRLLGDPNVWTRYFSPPRGANATNATATAAVDDNAGEGVPLRLRCAHAYAEAFRNGTLLAALHGGGSQHGMSELALCELRRLGRPSSELSLLTDEVAVTELDHALFYQVHAEVPDAGAVRLRDYNVSQGSGRRADADDADAVPDYAAFVKAMRGDAVEMDADAAAAVKQKMRKLRSDARVHETRDKIVRYLSHSDAHYYHTSKHAPNTYFALPPPLSPDNHNADALGYKYMFQPRVGAAPNEDLELVLPGDDDDEDAAPVVSRYRGSALATNTTLRTLLRHNPFLTPSWAPQPSVALRRADLRVVLERELFIQSNVRMLHAVLGAHTPWTTPGQAEDPVAAAAAEAAAENAPGSMPPTQQLVFSSVWVKQHRPRAAPGAAVAGAAVAGDDVELLQRWGGHRSMPVYGRPRNTPDAPLRELSSTPIIPGRPAVTATPYTRAPWHARLPHFAPGFDDQEVHGDYDELQTEYAIPMARASAVLSEIVYHPELQALPALLHISELRLVRGDAAPLSMCPDPLLEAEWRLRKNATQTRAQAEAEAVLLDGRPVSESEHVWLPHHPKPHSPNITAAAAQARRGCLMLQFTWRRSMRAQLRLLLPHLEDIIWRHRGRPHWGKFNALTIAQRAETFASQREPVCPLPEGSAMHAGGHVASRVARDWAAEAVEAAVHVASSTVGRQDNGALTAAMQVLRPSLNGGEQCSTSPLDLLRARACAADPRGKFSPDNLSRLLRLRGAPSEAADSSACAAVKVDAGAYQRLAEADEEPSYPLLHQLYAHGRSRSHVEEEPEAEAEEEEDAVPTAMAVDGSEVDIVFEGDDAGAWTDAEVGDAHSLRSQVHNQLEDTPAPAPADNASHARPLKDEL
jgi:hypothetical protein